MYVTGWETRFYGFSQCLSISALMRRNIPVTQMSWGEFKMAPAKQERVKRCDISTSTFTTIDAFFLKCEHEHRSGECSRQRCLPHPLLRLMRSTMLTCLAIITNLIDATVLSPIANSSQWPSVIAADFDVKI